MFTDIVGYTALMAESEEKGLRVRARHREVVAPLVVRYHGEPIEGCTGCADGPHAAFERCSSTNSTNSGRYCPRALSH